MTHTLSFRRLILALQRARRENLKAEGKPAPVSREEAGWTRRQFVKTAAVAGAAGAVSSLLPPPVRALAAAASTLAPRVAVVGGGIAGLNAAYQLKKGGIQATVYEARQRVGGRMLTLTGAIGDGLVTDLGGELINSDHEDMLHLAEELDIELFNRLEDAERFAFPRTGFFFDGEARSEAEVAHDLRALAAQIARDSEQLNADYERYAPALDQLSVADYLDRHARLIRRGYIRTLIEGSIRSEYGVEPARSTALQLIVNLPTVNGQAVEILGSSDEMFAVKGGSSRIIEGLAQQLGSRIRTRMQLTRLTAREDEFHLRFATGETVAADFVILAVPFPVLRDVDLDVPLPNRLRSFINEFELGRNEKLIAGFSERAWRQAEGFVGEAWTDLGYALVWDETQRQPERDDGALTYFMGGREVAALDEDSVQSVGRRRSSGLRRRAPERRLLRLHERGGRNRPPRRRLRGPEHRGADRRRSPGGRTQSRLSGRDAEAAHIASPDPRLRLLGAGGAQISVSLFVEGKGGDLPELGGMLAKAPLSEADCGVFHTLRTRKPVVNVTDMVMPGGA